MMTKEFWITFVLIVTLLVGCGTTDAGHSQRAIDQENSGTEAPIVLEDEENETEIESEEMTENESEVSEEEQEDEATSNEVSGELVAHFIDVGQADATLFQTDDVTILFDAGNWNRRDVVDYLLSVGIEKIDLLIGSHPDSDHIGQISLILDQFQVDEVWMSGNESTSRTFENALDKIIEHEVNYHEPRTGESYQLGELSIDVIAPSQLTNDPNEDSISVYFEFGETGIVMTGDAGTRAEAEMINARETLAADILHVGHHGSDTSTSASFLTAVDPDYAIISAGEGNSYGHPHEGIVDRLLNNGIEIFATYQHGTIIFKSDGTSFELDSTIDQAFIPNAPDTSNESNEESDPDPESVETESQNSGCININEATVDELMEIIHIGEVRADEIIDLRPFDSVDDLIRINGIGEARLEDILNQNKACVR